MINKLRKRFILIATLAVVIVIGILLAVINIINYSRVSEDADHLLNILSTNDGSFGGDKFNPRKDFGPETPYETRYFTVKYYSNGNIVTNIESIYAVGDIETAINLSNMALSKGKEKGYIESYRYLVSYNSNRTLVVFVDCSKLLDAANDFLRISIAVSLIATFLVFILVLLLSKKAIEPTTKSYEKQKRFITDAGHELKTPLTIISANNELIEMENGESEYTLAIAKQINRMNMMVKNLSTLARLDEADRLALVKEFSLTDTFFDIYNNFKTMLESKYIVNLDIEEDILFSGDENLIRQLLTILFDNCNKYALTKIDIKVYKTNKINIIITNDALNIENKDLKQVFERFYRSVEARGANIEGSGIGLSVAKDIVYLHKGQIEASGVNNMFQIKITL